MLVAARQRYNACLEQVTTWDGFMAALNSKHMVLAPWADEVEVRQHWAGPQTITRAC